MSATLDRVIVQLIHLNVGLLACRERLRAHTDPEALHDLRTTVRRLRSLLRPLRGLPGIDRLEEAGKALGTLTTPLRDREVLAAHLASQGHPHLAQRRLQQARDGFSQVAASAALQTLLRLLDAIVPLLRAAERDGGINHLAKQVDKRVAKQWRQLQHALDDPAHDRHRLRLLIKRARYAGEAFPTVQPPSPALRRALKKAQGALGDWHDRVQWLALAQQQPDLTPLIAQWHAAMDQAAGKSDIALSRLQAVMPH